MACNPLDLPTEFVAEVDVGSGNMRLTRLPISIMNRAFLELYNRELQLLYERSKQFAEEFPGVAERLGGLTERNDGPRPRQRAAGQRLHGGARPAQAEERVRAIHLGPARPAAAELSGADPAGDARPGDAALRRSGAGRRTALRRAATTSTRSMSSRSAASPAASGCGAISSSGRCIIEHGRILRRAGAAAGARPRSRAGHRRRAAPRLPAPVRAARQRQGERRQARRRRSRTSRSTACRSISWARTTTRSRSTSSSSPTAGASRSATSIPSATRTSSPLPLDLARADRLRRDARRWPRTTTASSRASICCSTSSAFPEKFLGFRLEGLRKLLSQIDAPAFDLIFEFVGRRAAAAVGRPARHVRALRGAGRQPVRDELQPRAGAAQRIRASCRPRPQPHARFRGAPHRRRLRPLSRAARTRCRSFRSTASRPRTSARRTRSTTRCAGCRAAAPPRNGAPARVSAYAGTELFISLFEPADIDDRERVRELSVRALASNRHLADQLPVGEAGADFYLVDDTSLPLRCVAGITTAARIAGHAGAPARRRGAVRRHAVEARSTSSPSIISASSTTTTRTAPAALRELLALFADLSDVVSEQRIRGIEGISSRPIVRRLRQKNGFNAARGIEITVCSTRRPSKAPASSCSAPCSTASSPNTPRSTASPRR